jgi:hypothetical protein
MSNRPSDSMTPTQAECSAWLKEMRVSDATAAKAAAMIDKKRWDDMGSDNAEPSLTATADKPPAYIEGRRINS